MFTFLVRRSQRRTVRQQLTEEEDDRSVDSLNLTPPLGFISTQRLNETNHVVKTPGKRLRPGELT